MYLLENKDIKSLFSIFLFIEYKKEIYFILYLLIFIIKVLIFYF